MNFLKASQQSLELALYPATVYSMKLLDEGVGDNWHRAVTCPRDAFLAPTSSRLEQDGVLQNSRLRRRDRRRRDSSSIRRIRSIEAFGRFASTHSQTLITLHPDARSARVLRRSRRWLRSIFSSQAAALFLGVRFRRQLCPCQKQPSTKIASLASRNTKSG